MVPRKKQQVCVVEGHGRVCVGRPVDPFCRSPVAAPKVAEGWRGQMEGGPQEGWVELLLQT
eukprot:14053195-Alexandrium_andersonii.AAC.1